MNNRDFGTYKQLAVWQRAMQLVKLVYKEIRQLPADEHYALSDQIRRAVVSIPANIAEGNGRASNRDYAHFLSIARGSLYETMTHLEIAESLGYLSITEEITTSAIEVRKMLGSMIKKFSSTNVGPLNTSKSTLKNKLNTICQYSLRHERVESTPIRVALATAPQEISAVGSFFHTPRTKM